MAKTVKCPTCGANNDKDETIQIGKRYYCKECADIKQKRIENYNKDDWDELFNYICKKFNIDKPNPIMFKQLKEYKSEPYCFKDKGIYLTLKYVFETLELPIYEDANLGIVPYYYDKAKKFYIKKMFIIEHLDEFVEENNQKNINILNPFESKIIKQKNLNNIEWEEYDE